MYFEKKINFLFTLLIFLSLAENSFSLEPNVFVQSTVNRASAILSDNLTKEEKIEKLKIIAIETVDIKGIGFYTLGKHRKNLNDGQKKIFRTFRRIFSKEFFK